MKKITEEQRAHAIFKDKEMLLFKQIGELQEEVNLLRQSHKPNCEECQAIRRVKCDYCQKEYEGKGCPDSLDHLIEVSDEDSLHDYLNR